MADALESLIDLDHVTDRLMWEWELAQARERMDQGDLNEGKGG